MTQNTVMQREKYGTACIVSRVNAFGHKNGSHQKKILATKVVEMTGSGKNNHPGRSWNRFFNVDRYHEKLDKKKSPKKGLLRNLEVNAGANDGKMWGIKKEGWCTGGILTLGSKKKKGRESKMCQRKRII